MEEDEDLALYDKVCVAFMALLTLQWSEPFYNTHDI